MEQAFIICLENEQTTIFFGYATLAELEKPRPTLKNARQIVYYSRDSKGLLSCAKHGVGEESRVGKMVDSVTICKPIEWFAPCSPKAIQVIENDKTNWSE